MERLGGDVIVSYKDDAALHDLLAALEAWSTAAEWQAARIFTRFLPMKNTERVSPVLRSGDPALPAEIVVTEAGVRYALDLAGGYGHGLFLDQRANRAKVRTLKPARVLNTFAHTCSFSVVAALAGAETVSIDLSRKSLDRGRQNFALNGIAEKGHRFIADDTLDLLPRMAARGERFDVIILDPPTFSLGKNGRRWQVADQFEDLLDAALEAATQQCAILLSTNCTKLDAEMLVSRARLCARGKRRTASYTSTLRPVDFPPGHGASTVWMLLR